MKLSEINEKNKVKISEGNANIICNDGSCSIDSNIGIMGIEINYTGKAEITPKLPEGWFLQGSNSKIIIFTLQQIPIEKTELFTYEGLVEIKSVIVADIEAKKVPTNIIKVKPKWENQDWSMNVEGVTWENFKDKSKKGIINKTKYNLPDYDLPKVDKITKEKRKKYKNFTRKLRETSRSTGGY